MFSSGPALREIPRSSGISSQSESYYSSSASISGALSHTSAAPSMVSPPPPSWSSAAHHPSHSHSANTNPPSSFSTGTLASNSPSVLSYLDIPTRKDLTTTNACLFKNIDGLGRMEPHSTSPADLYGIPNARMLSNCPANMMLPSNDIIRQTDSTGLLSLDLENSTCNSVVDPSNLRQLHQMSSNISASTSSSTTVFASPSATFEGAGFSYTDNSLLSESGPSDITHPSNHSFLQSSQYADIGTLQNEQLNDSFAFGFFSS